jgi:protein farnesyltransferase/geranylgeranyltransferase type-1 subunit alpha
LIYLQRYFVIKNSPLHGGIESVRDSELKYCEDAIALDAANESPWRYLKGLFKGDNVALVKNKAVANICMQELRKNSDCIFALDLSLDLILLGYAASHRDLCELFVLDVETSNPLDVASFICTRLKEIDPMRTLYWSWRQATLPSTLSGGADI